MVARQRCTWKGRTARCQDRSGPRRHWCTPGAYSTEHASENAMEGPSQRVLDLVPLVPTARWGRDEPRTGRDVELQLADLLAACQQRARPLRTGSADRCHALGWTAGLVVAAGATQSLHRSLLHRRRPVHGVRCSGGVRRDGGASPSSGSEPPPRDEQRPAARIGAPGPARWAAALVLGTWMSMPPLCSPSCGSSTSRTRLRSQRQWARW